MRHGRRPAAAALLAGLLAADCSEPVPARPSVVVYLVDTLRRDHLGAYGYSRGTSPRLDAFAADGIVFDEAYSPTSWTRPATATLLTGLYPAAHQAVNLTHRIPESVELLGERLRPLGYRTAAFVTNANVLPVWGFGQGFEHFDDVLGRTGSDDAELVVDAALAHLDRIEGPFFLYLHTVDPHGPYEPPEPWRSRFARGGGRVLPPRKLDGKTPPEVLAATIDAYDGEVAYGDAQFGRFLSGLAERGLLDDTLVVFTADHGDEHADHGGGGHAHTLFQELVHVPLVVRPPRRAGLGRLAGARCAAPVGLLDVVPTVLAAAGAPPDPALSGTDLLRVAGAGEAQAGRALYFDLDMQRSGGDLHVARGVLSEGHKLIRTEFPDPGEALYELAADPAERDDVAAARPEELERLRRLLARGAPDARGGPRLVVRGDRDRDVRVFTGLLRTDGRVLEARLEHGEAEDQVEVADGGRTVRFRLVLRNYEDPYRDLVETIVDEDAVLLRLEPLDARLVVESFEEEGAGPGRLVLGAWDAPPVELPLAVGGVDERLLAPGGDGGRETLVEALSDVPAGARLVLLAGGLARAAESVEMDPETRERLRALGYVE